MGASGNGQRSLHRATARNVAGASSNSAPVGEASKAKLNTDPIASLTKHDEHDTVTAIYATY